MNDEIIFKYQTFPTTLDELEEQKYYYEGMISYLMKRFNMSESETMDFIVKDAEQSWKYFTEEKPEFYVVEKMGRKYIE